jgi:hypothetical protein
VVDELNNRVLLTRFMVGVPLLLGFLTVFTVQMWMFWASEEAIETLAAYPAETVSGSLDGADALAEARMRVAAMELAMHRAAFSHRYADLERGEQAVVEEEQALEKHLGQLAAAWPDVNLEAIQAARKSWKESRAATFASIKAGHRLDGERLLRTRVRAEGRTVHELLEELRPASRSLSQRSVIAAEGVRAEALKETNGLVIAGLVLTIILLLLSFLGLWVGGVPQTVIASTDPRPLEDTIHRLHAGVGQLARMIHELKRATEQEQQRSNELGYDLSKVKSHVGMLLQSVQEMAESGSDVLERAETGQQHTQDILAHMQRLDSGVKRLSDALQSIEDAASRNELLALNAAIEGAKAGEAGRGFEALSSEMQRLAMQITTEVTLLKGLTATLGTGTEEGLGTVEESARTSRDAAQGARRVKIALAQQLEGTTEASTILGSVLDSTKGRAESGRVLLSEFDQALRRAQALQPGSLEMDPGPTPAIYEGEID